MWMHGLTGTWLYETRLRHISRALAGTATIGRWGIDAGSVTRLNSIITRFTALTPIGPLSIVTINWKPKRQKQTLKFNNLKYHTKSRHYTITKHSILPYTTHFTTPSYTRTPHPHNTPQYASLPYNTFVKYITLESKPRHAALHYPTHHCPALHETTRHDRKRKGHVSTQHHATLQWSAFQCIAQYFTVL